MSIASDLSEAATVITWATQALSLVASINPLIAAGEAGLQVIMQTAADITAGQASGVDPTPAQIAAQEAAIAALVADIDAKDAAASAST